MTPPTTAHSRIIFELERLNLSLNLTLFLSIFHQLALSFFHAYGYAYGSPEISRFSLLSNNLALRKPLCPIPVFLFLLNLLVPLLWSLSLSLSPPILYALLDVAKSFTWHLQHIVMKHTWLALWVVLHCRFCPAFSHIYSSECFFIPHLTMVMLVFSLPYSKKSMA